MKTGNIGWEKTSAKFLSDTGLTSEIYEKCFNDVETNTCMYVVTTDEKRDHAYEGEEGTV